MEEKGNQYNLLHQQNKTTNMVEKSGLVVAKSGGGVIENIIYWYISDT